MDYWACALARPNFEKIAVANLERQGFACYLPQFKELISIGNRRIERERSLFGRYLFVYVQRQWRAIFGTRGVASLLMNGDKPSAVPTALIDELKASEFDGFIRLNKKGRFKRGQSVEVTGGQFSGLSGIYEGTTSHDREVVLLSILGRKTRVVLAASDLA